MYGTQVKEIEVPQQAMGQFASGRMVKLQTQNNGDVWVVRQIGQNDERLCVIPKEKRCELAQFLAGGFIPEC